MRQTIATILVIRKVLLQILEGLAMLRCYQWLRATARAAKPALSLAKDKIAGSSKSVLFGSHEVRVKVQVYPLC